MKVALVHDFLTQLGGAERVLFALKDLYPDAPVYTLLYDDLELAPYVKNWIIRTSYLQRNHAHGVRKTLLLKYPSAVEAFDLRNYDLVISSSNSFAKGVITQPKTLHIDYCHSPTRWLWDWTHEYVAEQQLGRFTRILVGGALHFLRMWDVVAAERVDQFITNSRTTQERISKYYRRESTVIYPPVDVKSKKPLKRPRADYYLVVSRLSAYKRVELALKACLALRRKLIVVGTGAELSRLQRMSGKSKYVQFVGWKTDVERDNLIAHCRALIFPGLEDFGLVPVEAMAYGRPVVAYGHGGVTESVNVKTGVFFFEPTKQSLQRAIEQFEEKENTFDPKIIHRHAEQFDTTVFKKKIAAFIKDSLERRDKT